MSTFPPAELENLGARGEEVLSSIAGPRGGHVSSLFQMMLHSPEVTHGWSTFGNAIRFETGIDDRTRELIVLTVAQVTGCAYEWDQHETLALDKGMVRSEVEAIREWPNGADVFERSDRSVVELAAAVANRSGPVTGEFVDVVISERGMRGLVELVAASCYYVAIAHFVMSLGIDP